MGKCKNCTCKEVTDIIVVFDRSGSMFDIQQEMVGAYNHFIQEQRKVPGEARVTLVTFDNIIDVVFDKVDINSVRDINYTDVEPRGMTALNDAVGTSISSVDNNKTVLLILTDGYENQSKEYTNNQIKDMIKEKKEKGWDVSFIGADIDAFADGGVKYGIDISKTFSFSKTRAGVREFGDYVAGTATSYRIKGIFDEEEK